MNHTCISPPITSIFFELVFTSGRIWLVLMVQPLRRVLPIIVQNPVFITGNDPIHLSGRFFVFCGARSPGEVHCFGCSFFSSESLYTQKFPGIALKQRQNTALKWSYGCACCPEWANARPSRRQLVMPKISCRIWPTWSFEMPTVPTILRTFNWRSANTRL